MIRLFAISLSLLLLSAVSVSAQEDYLLELMRPRGNVRSLVETIYDSPSDLDASAPRRGTVVRMLVEYDQAGRLTRTVKHRNDSLETSALYFYADSAATAVVLEYDSIGNIRSVRKLFFDKQGRELGYHKYVAQSFLWNLPDSRLVKDYSLRGFLKRDMLLSRHGREISSVFYDRNHRGRLLRNSFSSASNVTDRSYMLIYHYNEHGDLKEVAYSVKTGYDSELLYAIDYEYGDDDNDNWQKATYVRNNEVYKILTRDIVYY